MNNNFEEYIKDEIRKSIELKESVLSSSILIGGIQEIARDCVAALRGGKKIILAGNGGSFADAQHLAAEFISRFQRDRPSLPAIALGTNISSTTAIGNDYGYENIFARELSVIGNQGDVFIAITTSGKSKNIIKALEISKEKELVGHCLTGKNGAYLTMYCSPFCVPSGNTAKIQEVHIMVGHIICGLVEKTLFEELSVA